MVGLDPVLYWSALTVAAVAILVPGVSAAVASVAALLLIAGPVLLAAAPSSAPWFSVPVALLLFAPGLIALRVNALIAADRYAAAHRLALVRALLHPFDGAFALARYCPRDGPAANGVANQRRWRCFERSLPHRAPSASSPASCSAPAATMPRPFSTMPGSRNRPASSGCASSLRPDSSTR